MIEFQKDDGGDPIEPWVHAGLNHGAKVQHGQMLVLLAQHVPSLSDEDESDIYDVMARMAAMDERADVADLAKRTCSCGKRIDGFYEYVDHLTEVFRA